MTRPPPVLDLERRVPRQQRSQESCAAIFVATAQILQREGAAALSTNRIAQRAGVSIGTLYQYFPNKQAVLLAMGRREIEAIRAAMAAAGAADGPVLPAMIRSLVAHCQAQRALRSVLVETLFSPPLHQELAAVLEQAMPVPDPAARFTLSRAMLGVLRGATLEDVAPEATLLERHLLELAQGYLARVAQPA